MAPCWLTTYTLYFVQSRKVLVLCITTKPVCKANRIWLIHVYSWVRLRHRIRSIEIHTKQVTMYIPLQLLRMHRQHCRSEHIFQSSARLFPEVCTYDRYILRTISPPTLFQPHNPRNATTGVRSFAGTTAESVQGNNFKQIDNLASVAARRPIARYWNPCE